MGQTAGEGASVMTVSIFATSRAGDPNATAHPKVGFQSLLTSK